jgi:hypothetical protein
MYCSKGPNCGDEKEVGQLIEDGEPFVPEMLVAARAMKTTLAILTEGRGAGICGPTCHGAFELRTACRRSRYRTMLAAGSQDPKGQTSPIVGLTSHRTAEMIRYPMKLTVS